MAEPAPALTASQTVGPFLHLALADPLAWEVVGPGAPGAIVIGGRITDGAGDPVPDGLVETWQVGADGAPAPGAVGDVVGAFDGGSPFAPSLLGRCPTDAEGAWRVRTVKPGRLPTFDGRVQAPFIWVSVFARGLLDRVVTRCYFGDEPAANGADPVLAEVPANLRHRLVATPTGNGYRIDIALQGPAETPFFSL